MAASLVSAATPAFESADASLFNAGPKAPAADGIVKAATRAGDELDTFDFSYSGYPANSLSLNGVTAGVSRVFMCFQMTPEDIKTFAGSKVTGFSVYSPTDQSNTVNSITDGRFFYSTSSNLSSADYSQDFNMAPEAYTLNKISIDEPYTITGEETALFFGYSVVVPKANNMYYVMIDGTPTNQNAGIMGVSVDGTGFPNEFSSFADYYGALCMSVTLERMESFPRSMSFVNMAPNICLPIGKKMWLPVTIKATSGSPIDSFDIEYTLGGNTYSSQYKYEYPYPAGIDRYIGAMVELPAHGEAALEDVEFRISKLNGKPLDSEGSTATSRVRVMADAPVHQTLVEEYTGTWCGYCPRGYAALEYIKNNYPDFVVASFHCGTEGSTGYIEDPMQVTDEFPVFVSSFPSASLNRAYSCDPYDGFRTYPNLPVPIVGDIEDMNATPTSWKVDVSHVWEPDSVLVAKAEVSNMVGYKDVNYEIAYLLVADSLSGATTRWAQTNYYYRDKPQFVEELNQFCMGGRYGKSIVAKLVFNDVVISADGIYGEKESVPASMEAEEKAVHTFTFDLKQIPSKLISNIRNLRVIAAVVDDRGEVLNCAKDEVNDFDVNSVGGILDDDAPVEYFNLNGMKVVNPTEGVFIRRQGGKAEKILVR